ncbi:MAG: uracil-DNA glycosylase [Oligoflexales bacterium]|nr:uracil-DNA glycosylase [Oligoflexales bacterium]
MSGNKICLESSWKELLIDEFDKSYMKELKRFLVGEMEHSKIICPKGSEYFAALNLTPFDKVKVVILGQDPYHGPGQAHGLSFSVRPGIPVPPSLLNIYKELKEDVGFRIPNHGFLEKWALQGVLLLNDVLTVECHRPLSHQNRGWEHFTAKIIEKLNNEREGIVFVLWGSNAQRKGSMIDTRKHLVLKSPHPSPLSASRGFFGCRHFSKINQFLRERGGEEIDWQLPLAMDLVQ